LGSGRGEPKATAVPPHHSGPLHWVRRLLNSFVRDASVIMGKY